MVISKKDKNGKIITTEVEEPGIIPIDIVNTVTKEIEFKKVDGEDKKVLAGAEFEIWFKKAKDGEYSKDNLKLYEKTNADGTTERLVLKAEETPPEGFTEVTKFVTGEDGKIKFKFKEPGYYALKEVKAPAGYINPRGIVKEFAFIDGKIQTDKYKTEMDVDKTTGGFYANGMHEVYNTDITMKINHDHEKITYEKDKSKITLSGLPLNSEYYENNISAKSGITINAKLVNKDNKKSSTKSYTVPLSQYGSDSKGNITIDLYELVKELEKKTGDSITSENTIELSMSSTLALSTVLDINSKIEIGDGEDKISEERTFHIGTKGDEKVNHSYSFTTMGEMEKYNDSGNYKPIEIANRKLSLPFTRGIRAWIGFTIIGLILMILAAYYYNKKKNKGLDFKKINSKN